MDYSKSLGDKEKNLRERVDWGKRVEKGFLAAGIDPADTRGHKNYYIDLLQKKALEGVMELKGDELVFDFGCGSGRISHWIGPRVKSVVGLEVTPEMIDLAEENRTGENVKFMVYDGVHFPSFHDPFDLILSVWVLQYLDDQAMKDAVSVLAATLKDEGRFCLIEQASDDPKSCRPRVEDYLNAFRSSELDCLRYYPIRNGRWWLLYLIRYGFVPRKWFPRIASWELRKRRQEVRNRSVYKDYLFLTKKR